MLSGGEKYDRIHIGVGLSLPEKTPGLFSDSPKRKIKGALRSH